MPVIVAKDPLGNPIRVSEYDGRRFPYFPSTEAEKHLPSLRDLACRDDDVMLLTYPKAGTNWTWEIINMLLTGDGQVSTRHKGQSFIEAVPVENIDKLQSVRILNTHLPPDLYPRDLIKRKNKIIFVQRNPKDVIVSFFYHTKRLKTYGYDGDWNGFFDLCITGGCEYGSWFNWTKQWEKFFEENKELSVLRLFYEEMKMVDLPKAIQQIAEFLGLSCDPSYCETVTEKCGFKNMQAERVIPEIYRASVHGTDHPMFRKGIVGDWKNHFTVAQNERFDQLYRQEMEKFSFPFQKYMK